MNDPISPLSIKRDALGRILPGAPGRPPGAKNRVSREAVLAIQGLKDIAFASLRDRIVAGDTTAIIYALDRILPKGRIVELDDASPTGIASALTSGAISPIEAKDIATAISRLKEIAEVDDLRARIDQLELQISTDAARTKR